MAAITSQSEAQEWYKIVTNWPDYWANFQRNYQGLLAQSSYIVTKHPEMRAEYEKKVDEGSRLYQRLLGVDQTVNSIKNTWGEFTGWLKGAVGLKGLDAIPVLIGAAAAAALIVSVNQWLMSIATQARRIELMKDLESKGTSPAEAARIASQYGGGSGSIFGVDLKWVLIGGAALLLLPVILPLLRGSR